MAASGLCSIEGFSHPTFQRVKPVSRLTVTSIPSPHGPMLNVIHKMSRQFYSPPTSSGSYLLDRCITNSIHGMHTKFHSLLGGLRILLLSSEFELLNIGRTGIEIFSFQIRYNDRHRVCLECVSFHIVFILGSAWGESSSSGRSMESQRDG